MPFSAVILGGGGGGVDPGERPWGTTLGNPTANFALWLSQIPKNKISQRKKIPSPLGQ